MNMSGFMSGFVRVYGEGRQPSGSQRSLTAARDGLSGFVRVYANLVVRVLSGFTESPSPAGFSPPAPLLFQKAEISSNPLPLKGVPPPVEIEELNVNTFLLQGVSWAA
jgi:hypothetical protein